MKANLIKFQQFWNQELDLANQETGCGLEVLVENRQKEITNSQNVFDVIDIATKTLNYIWNIYDVNRGFFNKIEKMATKKSGLPTDFPHQPERIMAYKNLLWETILDLTEDWQATEYSNNRVKELFLRSSEEEREKEREKEREQSHSTIPITFSNYHLRTKT